MTTHRDQLHRIARSFADVILHAGRVESAVRSGFRTQAISPQVEVMSLVGLVLLPIRFGRDLADKVLQRLHRSRLRRRRRWWWAMGCPKGYLPPQGWREAAARRVIPSRTW